MLATTGLISLLLTNNEVTSTICSFSKGIYVQLFSDDNRNDGPLNQGKNFLLFYGIIVPVPSSTGFRFVGQYCQSVTHDESRITDKRASTKTQNIFVLLHIK